MSSSSSVVEEKKSLSIFAKNLRWEISNSGRQQSEIANEIGTSPQNFSRWVTGQYEQPNRRYLVPLAEAFGYPDPESILRDEHISLRTRTAPVKQVAAVESDHAASFTDLLVTIDQSIKTDDLTAIRKAKEILDTPLKPYLLMAINWLDRMKS